MRPKPLIVLSAFLSAVRVLSTGWAGENAKKLDTDQDGRFEIATRFSGGQPMLQKSANRE
jgi:hypothetical protein